LRHEVSQKLTKVLEVLTTFIVRAIIALMVEAVSTSKTSVNFYDTTRRNIPEDSHLRAVEWLAITCRTRKVLGSIFDAESWMMFFVVSLSTLKQETTASFIVISNSLFTAVLPFNAV
jgi:hypothetical protein